MKNIIPFTLVIALWFSCAAIPTLVASQTPTPTADPDAGWTGTWSGTSTNLPATPDAPAVDVRREIGGFPKTDNSCVAWKTTYSEGGVTKQTRDYRLCRGNGGEDLYIDEGNGVRLAARWMDDVLVSMFTYDSVLLVATTRVRGDVLEEEIMTADHKPAVTGIQSLPTRGVQRLTLRRQP